MTSSLFCTSSCNPQPVFIACLKMLCKGKANRMGNLYNGTSSNQNKTDPRNPLSREHRPFLGKNTKSANFTFAKRLFLEVMIKRVTNFA
jgi:hypothetical protein